MGKEPHFISTWLLFGKEGTVKTVTNTSPKLADKVLQCRMVGYVKDHHGDLYKMGACNKGFEPSKAKHVSEMC